VKPEIIEEHMILADLLEQNGQVDGAIDELRGKSARSPIVEKADQHIAVLSLNYFWY